jgi:hypothetical protein
MRLKFLENCPLKRQRVLFNFERMKPAVVYPYFQCTIHKIYVYALIQFTNKITEKGLYPPLPPSPPFEKEVGRRAKFLQ